MFGADQKNPYIKYCYGIQHMVKDRRPRATFMAQSLRDTNLRNEELPTAMQESGGKLSKKSEYARTDDDDDEINELIRIT